jgi:hypothetical protein
MGQHGLACALLTIVVQIRKKQQYQLDFNLNMVELLQSVLTGMLIYLTMAIDFSPWAIKVLDKIRHCFHWRGRKEVKG